MKHRFTVLPLLLALLCAGGCSVFNPGTNPDGTVKKNPVTLTQRTTQYREVYLSVETSINDLFEQGRIPNSTMTGVIGPAMLSARQALKDMSQAAKEQNASTWGVFQSGFIGALNSLIAQEKDAKARVSSTTRPAFSPP